MQEQSNVVPTNGETNSGALQIFPEVVAKALMRPYCAGDLEIYPSSVSCTKCEANYPIKDGIPLLAREGTAETWAENEKFFQTSEDYQKQYHQIETAEDYNLAYKQQFLKRLSTKREFMLLNRLLSSQGIAETILDLPCGGGRLSPQIAAHTKLLIEADIGRGQVLYGSKKPPLAAPQFWMTASAFHIPFRNESVDGIVCCRLSHHMPTAVERERLLQELLRVSKRFVIMTFFDYSSLKNRLRRIRAPFDGKHPKMTMTVSRVRELAKENGAQLIDCPALSPASGHRYALIVK